MKTVHFVYTLPRLKSSYGAVLQKLGKTFFHTQLFRKELDQYQWPDPLHAPHSITYQLARRLQEQYRLKLYDCRERVKISPTKGDILLGHIWPDKKSLMWGALENPLFEKKCLIGPYNTDENQIGWAREAFNRCDYFFAITGDHWVDICGANAPKELDGKIVHLNMAIDSKSYPLIKKIFNPPQRRKFFYIGRHGRFGDEKGIALLEELAARIPGFEGGYICSGGDIKGWRKISRPTKFSLEFISKIAAEYDIFINMSRADAQATTILEAMSWGFPVACTRESGYCREENLFYLSLNDINGNLDMINRLQNLSCEELLRIASLNRKVVEQKYNWSVFVERVSNTLEMTW